jgi:hypothetical protein
MTTLCEYGLKIEPKVSVETGEVVDKCVDFQQDVIDNTTGIDNTKNHYVLSVRYEKQVYASGRIKEGFNTSASHEIKNKTDSFGGMWGGCGYTEPQEIIEKVKDMYASSQPYLNPDEKDIIFADIITKYAEKMPKSSRSIHFSFHFTITSVKDIYVRCSPKANELLSKFLGEDFLSWCEKIKAQAKDIELTDEHIRKFNEYALVELKENYYSSKKCKLEREIDNWKRNPTKSLLPIDDLTQEFVKAVKEQALAYEQIQVWNEQVRNGVFFGV